MKRQGRPPENIDGIKYNRLTVIRVEKSICLCKCDCGNEVRVRKSHVKNGHTKSCGCLFTENNGTHHLTHTRIYHIWISMRNRCSNKNYDEYYLYGGRGITVCELWQNDFMKFHEWAITHGYNKNLSIDRIENNEKYSPTNCRWATDIEQANNKRNNKFITVNNIKHTVSEWSRIVNTKRQTLQSCLTRHGESFLAQYIESKL